MEGRGVRLRMRAPGAGDVRPHASRQEQPGCRYAPVGITAGGRTPCPELVPSKAGLPAVQRCRHGRRWRPA